MTYFLETAAEINRQEATGDGKSNRYFNIQQIVSDGTDITYKVYVYDSSAAKTAGKAVLSNLSFTVKPADTGTEADAVTTALGVLMTALVAHLATKDLTSI
jgi:hypothetical protein